MNKTKIGWTHWPGYIGHTLNLTGGCTHVHEGCRNCYAERMTHRLPAMGMEQYAGLTKKTADGVRFTGDVRLFHDVLSQIATWAKPRCVFVNSMSDLFQDGVPEEFIFAAWNVFITMNRRRRGNPHIYLFLTKRPARMAEMWNEYARTRLRGFSKGFTHNIPQFGFGVSVSDQKTAEMMITPLLTIKQGFRFVSVEPMIGPVDLDPAICEGCGAFAHEVTGDADGNPWCPECENELSYGHWLKSYRGIDWVLCGCESGPRRRPMDDDWARLLRDQCVEAGVPFYLKQLVRNGKVTPSPELDGVVWNQFPKIGG